MQVEIHIESIALMRNPLSAIDPETRHAILLLKYLNYGTAGL
jgi:hypothetical protein